jgi:hypothetical protein
MHKDVRNVAVIVSLGKAASLKWLVLYLGGITQDIVIDVQGESSKLGHIACHIMQEVINRHPVMIDDSRTAISHAATFHELRIT